MNSVKYIDSLDITIVNALLKGEKVVIPDLGYLELKSVAGRRTVLFKALKPQDPFLLPFADAEAKQESALYKQIAFPLQEGKAVSLPQLGIFHPLKNSDGSLRVSFAPGASLRKQLNGEAEPLPEAAGAITLVTPEQSSKPEAPQVYPLRETKPVTTSAQQDDVIITPEEKTDWKRRKNKKKKERVWLIGFVALLLIIVVFVIRSKKDEPPLASDDREAAKSVNLPDLAKQHYGNAVFWVYIYEANQDRLVSPVNIPAELQLVIPDLSAGINLTDSTEIQRAQGMANTILRQKKQ